MIYSVIYFFSFIFSLSFWLRAKQNFSYIYISFVSLLAIVGTSGFINELFSGYFYRPEINEINKSHTWITLYILGLWCAHLILKIIKKNNIQLKRIKLPNISKKFSFMIVAFLSLFFIFLLFSQYRDLQIFNLGEISFDLDRWDFRFLDRNNSFLQVVLILGRATSYLLYIYGNFLVNNSIGFSKIYKYSLKILLVIFILFYGSATLDRAPLILSLLIIILSPLLNTLFKPNNYNKRFLRNFLFTSILGFCSALFAFSLLSGVQYNEQLWILGGKRYSTGDELDIISSFIGRIFLSPFYMMQKIPEDFSPEFSYIDIFKNGRDSVDLIFAQPMTWIGDIRRNFGTFYIFLFAFIFQSIQIIFLNSTPKKLINRSLYLSSFLIFCLSFYGNFIGSLSFLAFLLVISSLII